MNNQITVYKGHRFPKSIISHAVWLYYRFSLSYREVEELLAVRGVEVSYESIWKWCLKFPSFYAKKLRKSAGQAGDIWYLDEVFIKIRGEQHYLWRAVDQDGDEIDVLVQHKSNKQAALRFFRKLFLKTGVRPYKIVTDKFRSYPAALKELSTRAPHETGRYQNNRAELSHQPTRQRERKMRRFKSQRQTQQFLSFHGLANNLFRHQRHLLSAKSSRTLRDRSFAIWEQDTGARNPTWL
ncbi:IS6 family transposase [uncultured Desulfuromusa sp.]|uniref:IS6 family transposase n=1 Tax=uncultured Desulfuromusa sp. TaxID=219183 RepID=UPI002AA8A93C|nr:IS6 family transposase [uncultured Desulfuromusa sp.]